MLAYGSITPISGGGGHTAAPAAFMLGMVHSTCTMLDGLWRPPVRPANAEAAPFGAARFLSDGQRNGYLASAIVSVSREPRSDPSNSLNASMS